MNAIPATILAILVGVTDGDTIKVWRDRDRQVETIRLACIDAPELKQQPWGMAARDRLLELAPIGSSVEVRPTSRDRYGRTVAEVSVLSQNLNLSLVQGGYAVVYRDYLRGCDRGLYLGAEGEARDRRLNFWSQEHPTYPWEYRKFYFDLGDLWTKKVLNF